jgi:hypothetical protein
VLDFVAHIAGPSVGILASTWQAYAEKKIVCAIQSFLELGIETGRDALEVSQYRTSRHVLIHSPYMEIFLKHSLL